jgi:hypothetical protein
MRNRTATRDRATVDKAADRTVRAHIEHVKSLSAALNKAADTYLAEHQLSEAEGRWEEDFAANVAEASREFHRTLADSSKRVSDIYFGQEESESVVEPVKTAEERPRRREPSAQ